MTAAEHADHTFDHRPHLDGLRTVAVYLVVVFHAGANRLSGGFIGVDLFFVLSGYLVTHVLLSELWSTGSVSLRCFYARRVRRLLPIAFVTLMATGALFTIVASPLEVRASQDSFRAAFLYVTNWHFINASTDYFAGDLDANPVLHYWSLSIEEQFYVVWPVVLIGLTALRRRLSRGDTVVRCIVAVAVVASAVWAVRLGQGNVSRAYYGTDARAYQLLAGALLAMTPALVKRRDGRAATLVVTATSALSLLSIGLLSTSLLEMSPISRGILTTVAAIVALTSLERSKPDSLVRRALSTDAATYLGKISYGTYLWHWPVIIVLGRVLSISSIQTAVIAAAVATGLAALSSRLLELPIRQSVTLHRVPRLVAIGGVAASTSLGLLLVPRILESDGTGEAQALAASSGGDGAGVRVGQAAEVDWLAASTDKAKQISCIVKPVEECLIAEGAGPSILVIGDSHGVMVRPALEEIARRRDIALYTAAGNGCSWHIGLTRPDTPDGKELCLRTQQQWYDRIIPEIDPDLVIVFQRALDDPDRPFRMVGDQVEPPDQTQDQLLRHTAQRTFDRLRELDQPVAVIEPIPVTSQHQPLECLSTAAEVAACRYVATAGPTPLEAFYGAQVSDEVFVVDIDTAVCPYFPICDPVVDGMIVKWDWTHLTATYARAIAGQLEAALVSTGALDRVG